MVINVTRGRGFRGLLRYVLAASKTPEIVGGNVAGQTPADIASEFAAARTSNPRVKTPVFHCSLSIPPGEKLPPAKWDAISRAMLEKLGLNDGRPYLVVRHGDKPHDHAHLITNRVNYAGEVWEGGWQVRRALAAKSAVEQEFGLAVTPVGVADSGKYSREKMRQIGRTLEAGGDLELGTAETIRERIDVAIARTRGDSTTFVSALAAEGVTIKLNTSKTTGRVSGAAYCLSDDECEQWSNLTFNL